MRIHWVRTVWSVTLCVLIGCVIVLQWSQYEVLRRMAGNIEVTNVDHNTLKTQWITKSGGLQYTWTTTTTRADGESDADLVARHNAQVAADVAAHPIV